MNMTYHKLIENAKSINALKDYFPIKYFMYCIKYHSHLKMLGLRLEEISNSFFYIYNL